MRQPILQGGTFWHLNRNLSGAINMDDPDDEAALEAAQVRLGSNSNRDVRGISPVLPTKRAAERVHITVNSPQFCRVNNMNRHQRA